MAEMTPLKALFDNDGNPTSLAEFTVGDFVRVVDGGTGQATYSNGEILIGNSSGGLAKSTLTGTSNQITVTNGDGTITLSLPQDIHSGASPTFSTLTTTGNIDVGGNLTVTGVFTAGSLSSTDLNLILNSVDTPTDENADTGGIILKGSTNKTILWEDDTDTWHFNQGINITSGSIAIGSATAPSRSLHITATDGLVIPVGTTAQRIGTAIQGEIRYNTTQSTFEGYSGSAWGSLGGVIDVDQDTYVSAETTPGGDNDEIKFFTAGTERGLFCSDGALSIVGATTLGSTLGVTGLSSLNGGIAVDTNKFTVADGTGNTLVAGTLDATGDFAINTDKFTVAAATGNTVIAGNLTVDGTTTTVNTAEMTVDDPNITLNAVASPLDANADGGGITLLGTTNKTICWTDSTTSWDFNQKISVSQSGTAKADIVLLDFTNPVNAADMDGTTSSIRFNQYYYDATTPATADSAKLTIGTEEDWTSTATTQNSFISFSPACDGTISERMRITSGGLIGINQTVPRANLHIKQLCVPATGEGPLEDHFVLLLHGEVHSGSGVTEDCGKCGHEVCRMSGTDPTSTEAAKFGSKGFLFPASPSDDDRLMIKDCNGSLTWDGDFTLEFWTHICAGGCDFVFEHAPSDGIGSAGADDLRLRFYACDYRICSQGNWLKYEGSDCYIEHDVWFHVAVEREGTCWRMYHDGVVQMHWTDTVFTVNPNGCPFMLGGCSTSGTTSNVLCGYIDEVRISKGCAVYADNDGFDVPTAAYADTGGGDETTYDGLIKIDSDDDTNIFIINDCSCMVGVLQSTPAYNVDITGTLQATTCIVTPVAVTTNVGCENTVTGTNAYSFGYCNIVDANDSFAIGICAISCGNSSVALGTCACADTATGDGSLAFGLCSSAQGNYGIAIGQQSFGCTQTVTIGSYAESCGWCGVAVGYQACALGCRGIAIGPFAKALCNDSTAIGNLAKTEGLSSVAIGDCACSTNSNDMTIVIGYCSKADTGSDCTTLVGYCAYTHTADGATALGFCAEARSACALVLGGCCIGIGISSPTSDLHITGSTHLAMTDTTSTSSGTGNRDIASTAHGLSVGDSVKIPSGGNSTFEKFSVTTVTDADNFVVDSDLTNAVTDVQIYKDSSLLKIDTGDGVNKVTVDKSGSLTVNGNTNLGDGISSDVHTLFGKTSVTASTADYGFKIAQASTGDILQVFDDSTEVFTILDGGNVGISQTTPLCTLDVTGTLRATGNSTIGGTLDVTGDFAINTNKFTVAAATGNTVIAGNLTVDGTTTTVNSTTLTIDDKNIDLAHSPSGSAGNDAAVDSGGITLCSTEGNKTILFSAANDSWDFNQKVFVSQAGTAKADIILLDLTNTVSAADMDGTTSSILFNQYYYDASTPAKVDSGKITVGTETDWTSTASTQDSFMSFSTVLDGAVGEKVRIDSAGKVGIGNDLSASGAKLTIGGYVYTHAFTGIGIKQTTADHYGIVIEESASDGWLRLGHTGTAASIDSTTRTSNYTNLHLCTHSNKHISLLTDTGNVGIGTTAPTAKLQIGTPTAYSTTDDLFIVNSAGDSRTTLRAGHDATTGDITLNLSAFSSTSDAKSQIWFGDWNDEDVGMQIYDHTDNSMAFTTNASERMRIDCDGNVGIGSTSPTQGKLVLEASSGNVIQRFRDGSNNIVSIGHIDGSGGYLDMMNDAGTVTTSIKTYGDSYLTGGRLGIGTNTPLHYALHLACSTGFVRHEADLSGTDYIWDKYADAAIVDVPNTRSLNYVAQSWHSGFAWQARTSAGVSKTALSIDRHGSVIVGDSYYGSWSKLTVNSEIDTSSANVITLLQHTTGTPKLAAAIGLAIVNGGQSTNAADMYFQTASGGSTATHMTLSSTGKLGIGTTTPKEKLQIGDQTTLFDYATHKTVLGQNTWDDGGTWKRLNQSYDSWQLQMDSHDTSPNFSIYYSDKESQDAITSWSSRFTIDKDGYVGIGTPSPVEELHICRAQDGMTAIQLDNSNTDSSAGSRIYFQESSSKFFYMYRLNSDDAFYFKSYDGSIYRDIMKLCETGDVGIGTASPNTRLHVHEDSGANANLLITNESTQQARYGAVQSLGGIVTGSSDYAVSTEAEEVSGGIGTGLTVCVTEIQGGKPSKLSIVAEGSNYSDGDYVCITQSGVSNNFTCVQIKRTGADGFTIGIDGRENAKVWNNEDRAIIFGANGCDRFRVSRTGAIGVGVVNSGIPSSLFINADGSGYSTATNLAVTGGSGSNLTVDITASGGDITCAVINQPGSGYCMSDLVTVTGGGGNATLRIDEVDDPDASLHVMGQFRGLFREPSTNNVTKAISAAADPKKICFTTNIGNSFHHNLEVGDALQLPTLTSAWADTETFTITSVINACCVCVNRVPTFPMTAAQEAFKDGLLFRVQTGDNCDSVVIDSSGNLGVNVADPQYKLDVSGKTRFRGFADQLIGGSGFVCSCVVAGQSVRNFKSTSAHGLQIGDAVKVPTGGTEGCLALSSSSGTWVTGDTIVSSGGATAVVTIVYQQTLLGFNTGVGSFSAAETLSSSGSGSGTIASSGVTVDGRGFETFTVAQLGTLLDQSVTPTVNFVVDSNPTNTIDPSGSGEIGYYDSDLLYLQSSDSCTQFKVDKSGRVCIGGRPTISSNTPGQGALQIGCEVSSGIYDGSHLLFDDKQIQAKKGTSTNTLGLQNLLGAGVGIGTLTSSHAGGSIQNKLLVAGNTRVEGDLQVTGNFDIQGTQTVTTTEFIDTVDTIRTEYFSYDRPIFEEAWPNSADGSCSITVTCVLPLYSTDGDIRSGYYVYLDKNQTLPNPYFRNCEFIQLSNIGGFYKELVGIGSSPAYSSETCLVGNESANLQIQDSGHFKIDGCIRICEITSCGVKVSLAGYSDSSGCSLIAFGIQHHGLGVGDTVRLPTASGNSLETRTVDEVVSCECFCTTTAVSNNIAYNSSIPYCAERDVPFVHVWPKSSSAREGDYFYPKHFRLPSDSTYYVNLSTEVIGWSPYADHGFCNNELVRYFSCDPAATAIGGLTLGNCYYVICLSSSTFQLATTASGSALPFSSLGTCDHILETIRTATAVGTLSCKSISGGSADLDVSSTTPISLDDGQGSTGEPMTSIFCNKLIYTHTGYYCKNSLVDSAGTIGGDCTKFVRDTATGPPSPADLYELPTTGGILKIPTGDRQTYEYFKVDSVTACTCFIVCGLISNTVVDGSVYKVDKGINWCTSKCGSDSNDASFYSPYQEIPTESCSGYGLGLMIDVDTNALGVVCKIGIHTSKVAGIVSSNIYCDGTPITGGNAGYSVGNRFKVIGSDMDTQVVSVSILDAGTGYAVDDVLQLTPVDSEGTAATVTVTTVSGTAVSTLTVTNKGCCFAYADTYLNNCVFELEGACYVTGSGGTNLCVQITNLGQSFQEVLTTDKSKSFSARDDVFVGTDEIRIYKHPYKDGDEVTYTGSASTGSDIGGLHCGTKYYVECVNADLIKLAHSTTQVGTSCVVLTENTCYTKLLIHSDTTDGSTTFTDSSPSGHTLTVTGDAHHETTQKKFGSTAIQFDGTGDYLYAPQSSDFDLPAEFTIDWWAWKSANGSENYDGIATTGQNGSGDGGWLIELSSTRGLVFYDGIADVFMVPDTSASIDPNDSTWHHWALVRSGGVVTAYKDGVSFSTCSYSTTITTTQPLYIGTILGSSSGQGSPLFHFNGYLDEFRISKGIARWTTDFTPPTRKYFTEQTIDEDHKLTTLGEKVTAGEFVVGSIYEITTVGTTNFTAIGAQTNAVGQIFTATGVGSGNGIALGPSSGKVTSIKILSEGASYEKATDVATCNVTGDTSSISNDLTLSIDTSASGSGYKKDEIIKFTDPEGNGTEAFFKIQELECNIEWDVGGKDISLTTAVGPLSTNALELRKNTSITKSVKNLENYSPYIEGDDPNNFTINGTACVDAGSKLIMGTGTRFLEDVVVGDIVTINGQDRTICEDHVKLSGFVCTTGSGMNLLGVGTCFTKELAAGDRITTGFVMGTTDVEHGYPVQENPTDHFVKSVESDTQLTLTYGIDYSITTDMMFNTTDDVNSTNDTINVETEFSSRFPANTTVVYNGWLDTGVNIGVAHNTTIYVKDYPTTTTARFSTSINGAAINFTAGNNVVHMLRFYGGEALTRNNRLREVSESFSTASSCVPITKKTYNGIGSQSRVFMKALVQYFETDGVGDKIKVQFYDGVSWNDLFVSINTRDVDPRGWHKLTVDITPYITAERGKIKEIEYYYKNELGNIAPRFGGTSGTPSFDTNYLLDGLSRVCGGSGRGAQVTGHCDNCAMGPLIIDNGGVDYRRGDIVCIQHLDSTLETNDNHRGYAIVREVESENKIRFLAEFDGQDDYFRVADVVIYESDVPTKLGDVFLGKQKTGIGTTKPNNTLTLANKYCSSVALDFRSNDSTVCYTNFTDYSNARILSESLDDNYSGKKLHFQLPTNENTWKSNLSLYNGCVGIGTCFTDSNCLPAPNGTGVTGEGLHVLGNIRQNNSSLLQSSSVLDNRHEQTLYFDGSGDYVQIADNANLCFGTNDFSIETWVKTDTYTGNNDFIVTKGHYYSLYINSTGKVYAEINASGYVGVASTTTITDGKWHHVVGSFTRDGDLNLYVDGIFESSVSIISQAASIDNSSILYIGRANSAGQYFRGETSTVRLFKYALGPDDIRSLYNGKPVDYPEKGSVTIADQIDDHDFSESSNTNVFTEWERCDRNVTIAWNKTTSDLPAGYTSKVIGSPTSGSSGSYWDGVIRTRHDNDPMVYSANQKFQASFWAKSGANQQSGDADARAMRVRLVDDSASDAAQDYAGGGDVIIDTTWRKYYVSFVTNSASGAGVNRSLEFQVGNSDTPVHLTGVKFTRVGVALELQPEGISSSGGQWYDSSGIDNNGTITNASDKGKYVSPNYGWKTVNSGAQSSAFGFCAKTLAGATDSVTVGFCSCTGAIQSTAVGYKTCTSGVGDASAFGSLSKAQHSSASAIGYNNTASGCYSSAFGWQTTASGKASVVMGHNSQATVCQASAFGAYAKAEVECTTNIGGPIIIKKDSLQTAGTDFMQFSGVETVLMTKEIDLTSAATCLIRIPAGSTFWVNEIGIVVTCTDAVSVQPTFDIGMTDTNNVSTYNNFYVASLQPISISNITGRNRERYIPDNPDYGLDGSATYHTLKFTLTTVATATKMCGRIYYKGLLVENE